MQRARFIKAGLAAAAALSIAPAAAGAATLRDAGSADFSAGTPGTNTWVVEPGEVRLKTDVAANFDGAALAPGFTATPWEASGGSLVAGGTATVNGARVNTDAMYAGSRVLEFRATFGTAPFQHIGLGNTFNEPPWAQFSTGGGSLPLGFYARTAPGGQDVAITTVNPQQPHTYRIERSASAVTFFIDGIQMGSPHPFATTDDMRPVASDFNADATVIKVDWLALGPYPSSGAFVSRVHDASDPRAVWGALTAASAGGGVTFETRSGRTATPGADWSDWQATGAGGAIQSPPGRYIQYRATLAPGATGASPSLTSVELAYEVDTTAPDAAIGGVQVSGRTATVTFSSTAADAQRFECSLDGGAFAACASPQAFSGLVAGAHGVTVRAVDRAGNTGPEVASTFTVSGPAGSGDTTPPAVTVSPKSLRASKSGKVRVRVRCPGAEIRCSVKLTLKRGNTTAARKTLTVAGGLSRWVTLRLDKATRSRLATRGRLKARMVVAAVDAAGNKRTTTHALQLRAA